MSWFLRPVFRSALQYVSGQQPAAIAAAKADSTGRGSSGGYAAAWQARQAARQGTQRDGGQSGDRVGGSSGIAEGVAGVGDTINGNGDDGSDGCAAAGDGAAAGPGAQEPPELGGSEDDWMQPRQPARKRRAADAKAAGWEFEPLQFCHIQRAQTACGVLQGLPFVSCDCTAHMRCPHEHSVCELCL